jgi:hypothetical protein
MEMVCGRQPPFLIVWVIVFLRVFGAGLEYETEALRCIEFKDDPEKKGNVFHLPLFK